MTSSNKINKRFIGIPYWKCFTILGMTGILGWGLICKVYFIPCFAIRFQGIWCIYLFSFTVCFPEGNVWWTSQWPGYLESASWGDTPGVAVAMLFGSCFRVTLFTFYHGKSPCFTTNWGMFFYFFQASWPCKSKFLHLVSMIPFRLLYRKMLCFFGRVLGVVLLACSLQILDLFVPGDVWSDLPGLISHYLFQPSGENLKAQSRPMSNWLVATQIFSDFHPYLGKIPILTHIFQRGWKHQLANVLVVFMHSWGARSYVWTFVCCEIVSFLDTKKVTRW